MHKVDFSFTISQNFFLQTANSTDLINEYFCFDRLNILLSIWALLCYFVCFIGGSNLSLASNSSTSSVPLTSESKTHRFFNESFLILVMTGKDFDRENSFVSTIVFGLISSKQTKFFDDSNTKLSKTRVCRFSTGFCL